MQSRRPAESLSSPKTWNQSTLSEHNYPQIFVKFIKRLNELRLDFNIVVAVTEIESAYDDSDLQNFIYLLRSASVYLNQNSFLKFILTLKKCEPASQAYKSFLQHGIVKPKKTDKKLDENSTFEDALEQDILYQDAVVHPANFKQTNILKILQTGAICQVDDSLFFQKDG